MALLLRVTVLLAKSPENLGKMAMCLPGTQASLGPGVVENPIHSGTLFKKGQLELQQQDVGVTSCSRSGQRPQSEVYLHAHHVQGDV